MYNINSEAKSLRKIIAAGAADETMALPGPIANEPTRQVVLHSLQCSGCFAYAKPSSECFQ